MLYSFAVQPELAFGSGLESHEAEQGTALTGPVRPHEADDLALLDEVMAGLTPREITELMAAIRSLPERGVTVVWIEHVMMALMKVAQRVIVMQQGKVVAQGSPAEIAMNPAVIGAYLGETYVHAAHG